MRWIRRKHNTNMGAIRGDREGQNSRKEHNRRAENGWEQTETDRDGQRMFENKFYVTATLHTSFIWNVLWSRSMLRSPTILHHRFCNSHPNYNSPPCEGDSEKCYICSCHCLTTALAHHIPISRRIRRIVNKSLVQTTIRAPQLANRLIGDALTSFLSRCHPS